jgi:putative endonuclease
MPAAEGDRRARGAAVEAAARRHLEAAGLRPLAANANYRGGELDLVMLDDTGGGDATVVFVEVRYRAGRAFGGGAASMDLRKRRRLVRAAQLFLVSQPRLREAPAASTWSKPTAIPPPPASPGSATPSAPTIAEQAFSASVGRRPAGRGLLRPAVTPSMA